MEDAAAQRVIREAVREHDRDRYLCALFAPAPARNELLALYAFNADVARIPEAVSEPMLGEIRLQWWRDALDALAAGGRTGNPVADGLGRAMRHHELPVARVLAVIDARAFELSNQPMPDAQAFKAYLEKTSGTLFALAARILGAVPGPELDRAARTAGFAWGLTDHLRWLPTRLSRGRFYLPATRIRDHGAEPDAMLAGEAGPEVEAALAAFRAEAREALAEARARVAPLTPRARLAFLPLALAPAYLDELERTRDRPLAAVADIGPVRRLARLARAAMRGRP